MIEESGLEEAESAVVAARLVGGPIRSVSRVAGGGNNRLFQVIADSGRYALKHYAVRDGDRRDRLGVEFEALRLLAEALPGRVPKAYAADRQAGWALYEWIDGTRLEAGSPADLDAMLAFTAALKALRNHPAAAGLPPASEACLSLAELIRQNRRRLERLGESPDDELKPFLAGELSPLLGQLAASARARYGRAGIDSEADLSLPLRVLSPSDFGFHNMLRRPDGTLVFVDFEYFGWDDPVKLGCDVAWHPAMALPDGEARRFLDGLIGLFADDAALPARLAAFMPLIGLRWCFIVLNEFLPERWARRRHAGAESDWQAAKQRQLAKARALYRRIVAGYHPDE